MYRVIAKAFDQFIGLYVDKEYIVNKYGLELLMNNRTIQVIEVIEI